MLHDTFKMATTIGQSAAKENSSSQDPFDDTSKIILVTVLSSLCLISIIGNLIILTVIVKTPQLRNLTHILVANLCILDLACSVLAVPISIISILKGEWIFGDVFCFVNGYMHTFFCTGSILTLSIISIERYISIAHPLSYTSYYRNPKVGLVIAYIWLQSATLALPPLVGANSYVFNKHRGHCSFEWEQTVSHITFIVMLGSLCFLLPSAILLTMYCTVLRIARQTTRRICPEITEHGRVTSIVETGGKSDQRGSQARPTDQTTSGDSKAIKIILLLLCAFFINWTPFFALNVYGTIRGEVSNVMWWEVCSSCLAFSSCAIDPILYGLLNRNVRQEILENIDWMKDKLCGNGQRDTMEDNFGSEDFFQFLERTNTMRNTKLTDLEISDYPGQSAIDT